MTGGSRQKGRRDIRDGKKANHLKSTGITRSLYLKASQ